MKHWPSLMCVFDIILDGIIYTFGGETSCSKIHTEKLPDEQTNFGVAQFECLNSIEKIAKRCVNDSPIETRFELCFLNTIAIQGTILNPYPVFDDFYLIKSLMDRNLPANSYVCIADVRDVALAHVRALSVTGSRYFISGNVVSMRTVAGILHGEFRCQGYYKPRSSFQFLPSMINPRTPREG